MSVCRFRSRKDCQQTLFIPKMAIKECRVYHTILEKCVLKESLPEGFSDARLTLAYGEYYLMASEKVQPRQAENQGRVVALDPGVRSFMTFDVILLLSFDTSRMVSKSRRKICSKTVRQMLTLSHYEFKKHLEWKAWESGKVVLTDINEAYTSKTVLWLNLAATTFSRAIAKMKHSR